jgi:hypothetical protein
MDDFALDLSELTYEDLESANQTPPPGRYHARVLEAKHMSDQTPYLRVKLKLLAGTNAEGVGAVIAERFYLSQKAVKRLAHFGLRVGLLTRQEIGKQVTVAWGKAVGRELIVEVIHDEKEGKNGKYTLAVCSFMGFWDLDHPDVATVPRGTRKAPATTAKPAATSPAKDTADEGEWSDI